MATLSKGYTFGATEQVTNAKLHALVDSATIANIVNSDISATAAIDSSKLADIDGSKLTGLGNVAAGAGVLPLANMSPTTDTVKLTGDQTVAGVKTFSAAPVMSLGITLSNQQITGLCIENRTDDTGCTQTGRIWLRTDV
jgi:hypothetical protein